MDGGGIRFGGRTLKRHRHVWYFGSLGDETPVHVCQLCGKIRDESSRRGRNNAKRGKLYEREWCRRLGLRQTGGLNKEDDGLNDVFVGQAKSMASARFPSWMSRELDILRARWPDRIPILGILEAPGAARDHKPKRLIVIDEQDWRDLHVGTQETTDDR
jgi:hypothetical protein